MLTNRDSFTNAFIVSFWAKNSRFFQDFHKHACFEILAVLDFLPPLLNGEFLCSAQLVVVYVKVLSFALDLMLVSSKTRVCVSLQSQFPPCVCCVPIPVIMLVRHVISYVCVKAEFLFLKKAFIWMTGVHSKTRKFVFEF